MNKPTLFIDMDGVLVNFRKGYSEQFGLSASKKADNVDWSLINNTPDFFASLPPMDDFETLWQGVSLYNPVILTGVPGEVSCAANDKRKWVDHYIGQDQEMIACRSKDKSMHMRSKGDVLIDDWEKYKHLWLSKGGQWITHISAENSLNELKKIIDK